MSRESSFPALIIKKQQLGEADEIITLFSRTEGKVRAVSKSSKLISSKLSHALQPLFLIDVAISGKTSLPKLIRANILESYSAVHANPVRVSLWFVIAELIIKLVPDNQPNEGLYESVIEFLNFLNSSENLTDSELELGLLKFKLSAMEVTGLAIHDILQLESGKKLLFSSSKGGFYYEGTSSGRFGSLGARSIADSVLVTDSIWRGFHELQQSEFNNLPKSAPWSNELSKLVSNFISYQLEREIKSEKYL